MDRRSQILDSAESLMRQNGYNAISFGHIAEEVGIRKASMHHHFRAKPLLAEALIARYRQVFLAKLAVITAAEDNAGGRLLDFLDTYRAALNGGRHVCLCVAMSVERDQLSAAAQADLTGFHEDILGWLEGVFAEGRSQSQIRGVTDPRAEAIAALALVEGAQLLARSAGDTTRFEAAVSGLRVRCLN